VILVGTSGWQYQSWRGGFYPDGLPQRQWLEHYAGAFATVEVNNAFYRLPDRSVFADWRDRTPDDFVVAVKMSRFLTHVRRLRDPAEPVARFLGRARALEGKLGPVLLQLPPTLVADRVALEGVLAQFPAGVRVAVEPRHRSWWTETIRQTLNTHNAALCWADRLGRPVTPLWRTADFGYVRLHEGRAQPWPRYGRRALESWLERIADAWSPASDVFIYLNNDAGGAAVIDAAALAAAARARGLDASRAAEPPFGRHADGEPRRYPAFRTG
jgi:uncharacterized protein YecE (DUF72 family)